MAQNQSQDVSTEQLSPNNLVVRIDQDSASDLQALFDTVLNPDANRQLQVPLRLRNLPSSFFKPPSNGSKSSSVSHSRDNSADSAFDSGSASGNNHQVIHSRAHSSPASLQQTYTMGQQQNLTSHHHSKQRSYDSITPNDQMPLPPGWEQARTAEGQIYYLNHITCTTTWEDPRKTRQINQHHLPLNPQDMTTQNIIPNLENKQSTLTELRPLPYGWEQSTTPEGEIYFINHQTRTTSWFDPRIPAHLQRSPTNSVLPMMNAISSQEQVTQQKMRLQMLQLERERLKQRQEEIRRQQGMMMQTNVPTMDSYLSDLAEHSRQESADSGLGMGTSATNVYPICDSPEDFLANISNVIDHMECANEEVLEEFPNVTLDDVQSLINPSVTPPEMASNVNELTWL